MFRLVGVLVIGALVPSCAVLNTMGMSQACKDQYNQCLDGCPQPPPNLSSSPTGEPDTTTPSCVDACNKSVKGCR